MSSSSHSSAGSKRKPEINVVLDLDQTLISAEPTGEVNLNDRKTKDKLKKFKFHDMDGYYVVVERPGLQDFLQFLAMRGYVISVWTAASKDYALFIIKNILLKNPTIKLKYIFFSYHCDLSENKTGNIKDLKFLKKHFGLDNFDEKNTLIIDDYRERVHDPQPEMCIIAPEFNWLKDDSPNDRFLIDLPRHMRKIKPGEVGQAVSAINKHFHR